VPVARRDFLGPVSLLAGSAALAHGISAAVLPVISRLYTPADFGVLAAFAGLLSVISVAASLRFDVAIPLPEHDEDALNLLALAIIIAFAVSLALGVVLLFTGGWVARLLNQPALAPYLWLIPVGVALASSYSALQYWFVRRKEFSLIANSRLTQSSASAATQVAMGWLSFAPLGLLIGYIANAGAACIWLGVRALRSGLEQRAGIVSWSRMRSVFVSYSRFPRYSAIEALCNSASIHLPVIMIAALAGTAEAGHVMLAMTLMQAPMSLIGSAIGQVFVSRAATEHRAGTLAVFTTDTIADLLRLGVGPLLAAGVVSPAAFDLVFGAQWQRAGWLVAWMTPWFAIQFLAVPVAMALHVTMHQKRALFLQAFGLIVRVAAVMAASVWAKQFVGEAYAISGLLFYLAYLAIVLSTVKASNVQVLLSFRRAAPNLLAWIAAGVAIAWILHQLPHAAG
jgi:O-antigen/teichoic acid export membrane protein